MRWFDRMFHRTNINGAGQCPTYMIRWTLFRWARHRAIYLHHILRDDWTRDPHDHPKSFISIGLWGEYWEQVLIRNCQCADHDGGPHLITSHWVAPWFRRFPAEHIHRIAVNPPWTDGKYIRIRHEPTYKRRTTWTLNITGTRVRDWGFWFRNKDFVGHTDYLCAEDNPQVDC